MIIIIMLLVVLTVCSTDLLLIELMFVWFWSALMLMNVWTQLHCYTRGTLFLAVVYIFLTEVPLSIFFLQGKCPLSCASSWTILTFCIAWHGEFACYRIQGYSYSSALWRSISHWCLPALFSQCAAHVLLSYVTFLESITPDIYSLQWFT